MQINQRLFELLAASGKSQKELAQFLGISERNVSAWKSRGSEPPSGLVVAIADFFGVSVEWFLTGEEHHRPANVFSGNIAGGAFVQSTNSGTVYVRDGGEHALSAEAAELLRIYETLDIKRRMRLLDSAFSLDEERHPSPVEQ